MAAQNASSITAADPFGVLPVTLEQRVSIATLIILGAFIATTAAVLLTPFAIFAIHAAADPAGFLKALSRPTVALQLGLALLVAIAFVLIPSRLLVRRAMQPRRITISADAVKAIAAGSTGEQWSEPLAAYRGVAHHIRTSLSGAQHEIVLVHAQPGKSVVLQTADRISQPHVDAIALMLKLNQVPARMMYERRSRPLTRAQMTIEPLLDAA